MPEPKDPKAAERRLKQAKEKALRKRMGPPLDITDEGLDEAAQYRQVDQEAAADYARRNLPPELRGLVDAEVMERDE